MDVRVLLSDEKLNELSAELEQVRRQLEKYEDDVPIADTARETTEPQEELPLNGSLLRVDSDDMTAWLLLKKPGEGEEYTKEDILEFLNNSGITSGYHHSNITAMVKKRIYNREVRVAVGKLPQPGQDGFYEYFFMPVSHREPAVREDGSVDYTAMSMLQNVKEGEKIALYHAATKGEDGYTVRGSIMKAKPTRELPPMHGRNIAMLEDGVTYVARADGKIELRGGRIDIQKVHEIRGDVTLITGKVEFYGDVVIHGNVETGVVIRSGRNIVVTGTVEGAEFYAGGDVILERGITGGMKAKISALGSVFADFIDNAWVKAGGDVKANTILNSTINAEGMVILTGRRGELIGGYTHGLLGVEVVNAGNTAEIKTIIHAGYDPESYSHYLSCFQKEKEAQKKLAQTVNEMTDLLRLRKMKSGRFGGSEAARLLELDSWKDKYVQELEKIRSDKEALSRIMEKGKGAEIRINEHVYRGVIICVETAQSVLEHGTCFMKYKMVNGAVAGQVIVV